MTTNPMYTPWGWTTGHRVACRGRLESLDAEPRRAEAQPRAVGRNTPPKSGTPCSHQTFAEEDCEEPIVRTLLGLADEQEREMAVRVADYFERYAPRAPLRPHLPAGTPPSRLLLLGRIWIGPLRAIR